MTRLASRAALTIWLLAVPAAAAAALGHEHEPAMPAHHASIAFASVSPERLDIVAGETIEWTNDSARVHTVTADDGSFDSGRLGAGQTFSRRFAASGETRYHCVLHPSIRGVAAAHDIVLDAPEIAASPGAPYPLTGRAAATLAAGTAVAIQANAGGGFETIATTTIRSGGTIRATLTTPVTASYRAVAGEATSPPVQLLVLDRHVSLSVRREGRAVIVRADVSPPAPGASVVLQQLLPERFGWWPVQRATLDKRSSARFELRPRRRLSARVRLTLPDGATPLATSPTRQIGPRR